MRANQPSQPHSAGPPNSHAALDADQAASRLVSYGEPLRPMTGIYRTRNPALVAFLRLSDYLGRLRPKRKTELSPDRRIRILIANWAHLGDVIVTLPLLKYLAGHPRVESVSLLVGSWSRGIASSLPFIKKVHYLDHFFLDRGADSKLRKLSRYFFDQMRIVREIRDCHYDISVDLVSVFPATHRLLWKAEIPTRIGFSCTGYGAYLTHRIGWSTADEHVLAKLLRLFEPLFGDQTPSMLQAAYPDFIPSDLSGKRLPDDRNYVLMHMGSGDYRSWPTENWLELGRALQEQGRHIVFTGSKGTEADMAERIAKQLGAKSVAGALSWNEFVTCVANAAALISVDTVTGHLAACFATPSLILLSGRWGLNFFRPNSEKAITITYPVGCTPCYRSFGCETMACVRYITVADVLAKFNELQIRSNADTDFVRNSI